MKQMTFEAKICHKWEWRYLVWDKMETDLACFKTGILLVAMFNCMMPLVSAQSP